MELLTVVDTKTYVVTLSRGGEGVGECLQSKNILCLLPTPHWPCSADWLVTQVFIVDVSSTADTGGRPAVTCGSGKVPQLKKYSLPP